MTAENRKKPSARPEFEILYTPGQGYAVFDEDGVRISGYNPPHEAVAGILERKRAKSARDAGRRNRNCLCCGAVFASQGIHNRLCRPCRGRSQVLDPVRPYIPRQA